MKFEQPLQPTPQEIENAEKELHMSGRAMRTDETLKQYKTERKKSWEEKKQARTKNDQQVETGQKENENFDEKIRNDYYNIAKRYFIEKNGATEEEAEEAIQRTKNMQFETNVIVKGLIDKMYYFIRLHDYPKDEKHEEDIDEKAKKSTKEIYSKNENGWYYRNIIKIRNGETYVSPPKIKERISLNVIASKELIDTLDKFILEESKPGSEMYYKVPNDESRWLERHDPVTIYLESGISNKAKEKLVQFVQQYIRSKEDVLPGEKISDGISFEKSPSEKDLQELIDKGYKINNDIGKGIKNMITEKDKLKASAGQVFAIKKFLEEYYA